MRVFLACRNVMESPFCETPGYMYLNVYQLSAPCVHDIIVPPFPRHGKGGTFARVHVQMCLTNDLCNMHRCLVSNHTTNLVAIGRAIPEL